MRRGSFANVEELQQAILEFLAAWNEDPKPFVWTATVQKIQEKLARCRRLRAPFPAPEEVSHDVYV